MITQRKIETFFNEEAYTAEESHKNLMKEKLSERIRKRKAIAGLRYVKGEDSRSPDNELLLKLSYTRNLSDFKAGDCLILHNESFGINIECTLNSYNEDGSLTISVFPTKMNRKTEELEDTELILDKAFVDLRQHVYYPFCSTLQHTSEDDCLKEHFINTKRNPEFENYEECEKFLDRIAGDFKSPFTEKQREAIINSWAAKDYYLIQGPPGTGKSFVLSVIILGEMIHFNRKVLVIGPNHMAINNVLEQILKVAPFVKTMYKVGQNYNSPGLTVEYEGKTVGIQNFLHLNVPVAMNLDFPALFGMTPHCLYTSRARGLKCDTLIIDEAGQMTIPLALMGIIRANKVIFAGDHKQLPPIITSDKISSELKCSIFKRLLTKENHTMLDTTFRMCKTICDFVSELFYSGKLKTQNLSGSGKVNCENKLYSFDTPVVLYDVDDNGQQVSEREAEEIVKIIKTYLGFDVPATDIGILSPFRAQAAHIKRLVRKDADVAESDYKDLAIDTIDKMQGQERDVIIVSLVAGDLDYMTEMGEFLYNPYKLNVAFSRAKSKLIVVGNVDKLRMLDKKTYPHINKMLKSKNVTIINN